VKILTSNGLIGVLFAVCISYSSCAGARDDNPDSHPGLAPLFANHAPLEVTIEAPLTTLMEERPEKEYLEGTFSYTKDDGTQQTFDLKLRTRGNFRRSDETCDFAPVRLNFRKKQLKDTEFDGQDKLKLVTHCQQNKMSFEQLVLREYLAYRILQVMTDKSFGVRLFHINWLDTERGKSKLKYGFVLEDDDDVADRFGMKSLKLGDVTHEELDPRQENLVNMFQYMIGNTDYSLVNGPADDDCCHNSMLLSATDGPPYTPLPYDFDFAGLVNAPYAAANPAFKLPNVRVRLYRGQCSNNELLPDTIQHFLDKKDAVYAIIDELDMFSSKARRGTTSYVNSFYRDIMNPKLIQQRIINYCNNGHAVDSGP
jgi:hypothetical protein